MSFLSKTLMFLSLGLNYLRDRKPDEDAKLPPVIPPAEPLQWDADGNARSGAGDYIGIGYAYRIRFTSERENFWDRMK